MMPLMAYILALLYPCFDGLHVLKVCHRGAKRISIYCLQIPDEPGQRLRFPDVLRGKHKQAEFPCFPDIAGLQLGWEVSNRHRLRLQAAL